MEITIDDARHEQSVALAAVLQFFKNWTHMLSDESPILFGGGSSLLELPLPFEQRGLVDKGEDIRQRNVIDRKSTRLNSSHVKISYAVFCLKKKNFQQPLSETRKWQGLHKQ